MLADSDDEEPDMEGTGASDEEEDYQSRAPSNDEEEDDGSLESNDPDEEDNEIEDRPEGPGFVDLHITNYALRDTQTAEAGDRADSEELGPDTGNEADDYLDNICILTDYWYRPTCMKNFHYAFVRENFHLVRNKPPENSGLRMQLGHPNPDKGYWLRNEHQRRRCLIFVGGKVSSNHATRSHSLLFYNGCDVIVNVTMSGEPNARHVQPSESFGCRA